MWRNIALGTVAVGVLDITEPMIFYWFWKGVKPIRILQSVAAGLMGRDAAFLGGTRSALLGLALHFLIAFVVVLVYHQAAARVRELDRHPFFYGALYGLAVYAVMNFVVLPLSATGAPKLSPWIVVANGLFAHVVCVGIPASLTARAR
jgi:uncharacterized membrane protein YagU involved in acid resistance